MKRILTCLLTIAIIFSSAAPVYADSTAAAETVYEEILTYADYIALSERYFSGEDFSTRYFKLTGEITSISAGAFYVASDTVGSDYEVYGSISEEYLGRSAVVYCHVYEAPEPEYFLALDNIEYGEDSFVLISSEEDLAALASASEGSYRLADDIVLTGEWTPFEFNGTLDGNGHTISGLTVISDQEYSYDYAGLFSVNNGTIKNLTVETSESGVLSLRGDTASAGIIAGKNIGTIESCSASGVVIGAKRAGGITAYNSGTVEDCFAKIEIDETYSYQGGLIGYNSGSVIDSHTEVDISAGNYVGGLIGESSGGEISGCYAVGRVLGGSSVGGLVGYNRTEITNCYAECNVVGNDSVGGLCGYSNDKISGAYASGSVVGSSNCVGGLIGRSGSSELEACRFNGSVKSNSSYVGGLIGHTESNASIRDSYAKATVQGSSSVGGLVGYGYYSPSIVECYAEGSVIASGNFAGGLVGQYHTYGRSSEISRSYSNADVWGATYVGGLIGYFPTINGSYTLTVKDCYSTGAVDGTDYLGGLIGYQGSRGHFYNSYAVGPVTEATNSGGITGWRGSISSALIEKCYYDIETTGMEVSEDGIGKSTAKMKTAENYLTWDFDTVWAIASEVNGGYPYLNGNFSVSEEVTTVIESEAELRAISSNLSGSYILNNDIVLTSEWDIIGDENLAFYGSFDGNGYTIGNFSASGESAAFVHSVAVSGVIKNLNLEIAGEISASGEAGGIAVYNYGTIENCSVSGKITNTGDYTGGIAAVNHAQIIDCHTKASIHGGLYVGGIAGQLTKGSIVGSSAAGTVFGTKYIGGAVGYMKHGTISETSTAGIVSCTTTDSSDVAAGGLIGYAQLESSGSFDAARECVSSADVSGYYHVGGLIGRIRSYDQNSAGSEKYVKDSYATGNINGSSHVGSFVGRAEYRVTLENCYIDSDSIVSALGYTYSGVVTDSCFYRSDYYSGSIFTNKSSAQLKLAETFEGWDFTNIWGISSSVNGGKPYLLSAPTPDEDSTFILIHNERELAQIADDLTAKYRLATDIVLSSAMPMLGSDAEPFNGLFDGNGFTITNKAADESGSVYPLFGTIGKSGSVKNLVLETAVDLSGTESSAGGLALVNNGLIDGVTVKGSVTGSADNVGGIAALNNGVIHASRSEAEVSGQNRVGGIAGTSTKNIVSSCARGDVTASGVDVGGIVGRATNGLLVYCESYSIVYGGGNVGGIAGYVEGNVNLSYCCAKGEIGAIDGTGECFGGLIGYLYRYAASGNVYYCYSSAKVKGYKYVGGLIGRAYCYQYSSYIRDCYAVGEVAGNSSRGSFVGDTYISNATLYVQRCYSAVKCGGYNAIGYVGNVSRSNCYFNIANSGTVSDTLFTALTEEEFKLAESFVGFDFETVWAISSDKNGGYPYLAALGCEDYFVEDGYEYTLIHDAEELFRIRKNLSGKYKLANDIEITDTWQPIGDSAEPFNGILDGNGFKIYNFHVLRNEEYEYTLAGLFGYIGNLGEVRNLTVETSELGVETMNSGKYAGIIAANNYGKLDNCRVFGRAKATDIAGGIVARNYGMIINSYADVSVESGASLGAIAGSNSGSIQNSSASGLLVGTSSNVGGIAGSNSSSGYINNCYAGELTVKGKSYVGGIVGRGGTVRGCRSEAAVIGGSYVGGISGASSALYDCEASCIVTATGDRVGGIVGDNSSGVTSCSFVGRVSSSSASSDYIGGIAGYSNAAISDCVVDAEISGCSNVGGIVGEQSSGTVSDVIARGSVHASTDVGGVVGDLYATLTRAYSTNSVFGKSCVGGIVGYINGPVTYCYGLSDVSGLEYVGGFAGKVLSSGNITLCFAKGDVIGRNYVGGFAGSNDGYLQFNYSIGRVVGGDNVGGFLGTLGGRILNCYYDSETSEQSDTGKGLPKTTEQLKRESVYIDWDFDNVWRLSADVNSGYPYFDGYVDEPAQEVIEISDKAGFMAIAENPLGSYRLTADIELDETMSTLGSFGGHLDGDGHRIYGFSLSLEAGEYAGLFEELRAGGVIENLIVEYGQISVADSVTAAGALVGINYGTVKNCTLNGDISGKQNIGGIVGDNYALIESSTALGSARGEKYVGGISARNYLKVDNCQAKAEVFGNSYVGGLVGYDENGCITRSSATGSVSMNPDFTSSENKYLGGLVGRTEYSSIDSCLSANAVSGKDCVGGLVGYDNYGQLRMSSSSSAVNGSSYVGGFVGESCYSDIDNCYSSGSASGSSYVGSFVGDNERGNVSCSYSSCEVITTGERSGGFVGYSYYGVYGDCYSAGAVEGLNYVGGFVGYSSYDSFTNCLSDSDASGNKYVAGFLGCFNYTTKLAYCTARAAVSGNSNTYGFAYWYRTPSSIADCVFNATLNSCGDTQAAPKTDAELASVNPYLNWDFETSWVLDESVAEYPYLAWQKAPGDLPTVIPAASVTLSSNASAVSVGEALTLEVKLQPANSTDRVVLTSSNENVALVKPDGTVVAVSEGMTTVTATAGNVSASLEIEVVAQNKSGNIVRVVTVTDISVPYDTELGEMLVMLPAVVEVMLSTGVVASLEVSWRHIADSEYEFSGTISIPDNINITNTNGIFASATVTKEPEVIAAREILSAPEVSLGVVSGTSLSSVLAMLPESVSVTLDDGSEAEVSVAWSETSEPYYNAFTGGAYVFTGSIVLEKDGSIKNTNALTVKATVSVAGEELTVRNITSAMAQNSILIEDYTTLSDVLAKLPGSVYAVVDNMQTVSLPVTWSSVSEPTYNPRVAGSYTFYGAFILPTDGSVTNTLSIRPTVSVVVSSSVTDEKAITVVGKTAEIGTTTDVSVVIDANTKMASGSLIIDYDATLLTPVSYRIGSVIEETSAMVNLGFIDSETGERRVKLSWVGANEINAGGELVNVTFLVSEGAPDDTDIAVGVKEVLIEDMDLNLVPCRVIPGAVKAVSIMLGDNNSDGRINIQDAFRILLMDIGRITFTDKQLLAADVNKDGIVDIFDAMRIQKYDIGLSDSLN